MKLDRLDYSKCSWYRDFVQYLSSATQKTCTFPNTPLSILTVELLCNPPLEYFLLELWGIEWLTFVVSDILYSRREIITILEKDIGNEWQQRSKSSSHPKILPSEVCLWS